MVPTTFSNIYCIWYPSGGFGHFVNAILSIYGKNFVRPKNQLIFSKSGNSHSINKVVPTYYRQSWPYKFQFDPTKNYSVLIDNGINDEGDQFRSCFANSQVIKICYMDKSWPIVARTMIEKALVSTIEKELVLDTDCWPNQEPWALREKYFLFLRDHDLRTRWQPNNIDNTLFIDDLTDYKSLYNSLILSGIDLASFEAVWQTWYHANARYIMPVIQSQRVLHDIKHNCHRDLSDITDIWEQAVLYYYIWIEFGIEVPHNDFANFFTNTTQIQELI